MHNRGTNRRRVAIHQKGSRAAPVEIECCTVFTRKMAVVRGGGETVACESDGFGEEIMPGQPAKALMHRRDAGEHARDRDRKRSDAWYAAGVALLGRSRGSRPRTIEYGSAPARLLKDLVKTIAAEP